MTLKFRLLTPLLVSLCITASAERKLEKMADGLIFPEGPCWLPAGYLVFSDIESSTIMKLKPSGGAEAWYAGGRKTNGPILNKDKTKLIAASHKPRELIEIDLATTQTRILTKDPLGKELNHVNDVAVDSAGNIFFTDPKWGLRGGEIQGVYRYSPDGKCVLAVQMENQPNGIGISPDQKWVYVARTGGDDIWRFALVNGELKDGKQWAKLEDGAGPDGMTLDSKGNIYQAHAGNGKVSVISPDAKILMQIKIWERMATNCEFEAGSDKILYVTGNGNNSKRQGEVYRVTLD